MTVELEKQLAELNAKITQLETEKAALQTELNDTKTQLTAASAKVEGLENDLKIANKAQEVSTENLEKARTQATTLETSLKASNEELAKTKLELTKVNRIKFVQSKLKADEAKATKLVESALTLTDEQFTAHVEAMSTLVVDTELPENVDNGKVDAGVLETAKIEKEPALSTSSVNDGVENVRLAIAKKFGWKPVKEGE